MPPSGLAGAGPHEGEGPLMYQYPMEARAQAHQQELRRMADSTRMAAGLPGRQGLVTRLVSSIRSLGVARRPAPELPLTRPAETDA